MRAPALAVALAACGGDRAPAPPPPTGVMPAIDALVAGVRDRALPALDAVAEPIGVPLHHDRPLWRVAGAKGHVAGVDAGGGIVVWDARTARPLARFQASLTAPERIAITPDGQRLELFAGPSAVVVDLDTGAELETVDPEQPADALATSGRWAVTPRGLVDPDTDRPVLAMPDTVAAFGEQLVTVRGDVATLWTFGGLLIGHSDAITAIVPRGERLLTASRDGLAIVWKNGAIQHAMPRAAAPLVGADFVTDTRLVTGDASGEVHLWDIDSGADLARWTYPAGLACLAVQADGRVAVATLDQRFETRDAVLTHPLPLATAPCAAGPAAPATMGDWRITGDGAGNLRLHPRSVPAAIARACGILRRFDRADELGAACR